MAIKLNTERYNLMRQIQKSGVFAGSEMKAHTTVISYLRMIKESDLADWIEKNTIDYLRGLLEGFEVDNSQAAQLKDIHTKTAEEALKQQRVNEQAAYTGKNI